MAQRVRLKPLREQVIVITGASSGIGLVTARAAVRDGARVVFGARSEDAIRQLDSELGERGVGIVADVSVEADVRKLADTAIQRFGGFDTWVNNAGVGIYGKVWMCRSRKSGACSTSTSGVWRPRRE